MSINTVKLIGKVADYEHSHSLNGTDFYKGNLLVTRTSGTVDKIPFDVKTNTEGFNLLANNAEVLMQGELRSYIKNEPYLKLKLYATKICNVTEEITSNNTVKVDGIITKQPNSHISKTGSPITSVMIKHIKNFGNSEYVKHYNMPIVAFKEIAKKLSNMQVNDQISIIGRLQSRVFDKTNEDGTVEKRNVCEIAVYKLNEDTKEE